MPRIVDLLKDEDDDVRAAATATIGKLAGDGERNVASTHGEETELRG